MPAGTYTSLVFRFGVSGDVPFGDLPTQDDYNNMEWPAVMGGGYHYMRLEGLYGDNQPLLSHTGPAGGGDYSFVVELPVVVEIDGQDLEIQVLMDLNEWFEDPFAYDFAGTGMIMGNADAQLTHQENGATVFSVGYVGEAKDHSQEMDDDPGASQNDEDEGEHDH